MRRRYGPGSYRHAYANEHLWAKPYAHPHIHSISNRDRLHPEPSLLPHRYAYQHTSRHHAYAVRKLPKLRYQLDDRSDGRAWNDRHGQPYRRWADNHSLAIRLSVVRPELYHRTGRLQWRFVLRHGER